jgi:hypothetical protein
MAEKLLLYYKYIGELKSLEGKIKLALLTKIPSTKAAFEPDSDENIKLFRDAFQDITGREAPNFD